jgi:hypothetical protein
MSTSSARTARTTLKLGVIRVDGDTQHRVALNEGVVCEYAALMAEGVLFPPVRVWFDGEHHWLADGFHRLAAAQLAGVPELDAEIRSGSLEDARWYSFGANATNGIRRSKADIEFVIVRAVAHQRALAMSTNDLARHVGIPESTLRRLKKSISSLVGEDKDRVRTVRRSGVTYSINTQSIGMRDPMPRPLREGHRLKKELSQMQAIAVHPDTRSVLAIVEKWFMGQIGPSEMLHSVDRLVMRIGSVVGGGRTPATGGETAHFGAMPSEAALDRGTVPDS